MQRVFARNILFLVLVNLVVKPLWIFGIDRNVQLHTGNEAYGLYFALFNFSLMFQIFLDMGMLHYSTNKIARHHKNIERFLPNILLAKLLLTTGYLIIIMAIGFLLGYRGFALFLLLLIGILQAINSVMLYLRSNVAALQHFTADSLLSIADRLFVIIACGTILIMPSLLTYLTIKMFVLLQIAGMVVTSIIAFVFLAKKYPLKWHFNIGKALRIIKQSLPFAFLVFLMATYMRIDAIILETIKGSYEVGVYARAFRLLDVANNLSGVLFAGILLPMFGKMLRHKEHIQPIVSLCLNIMIPIALTATIAVWYWGDALMQMLYKSGYQAIEEQNILLLLMISYIFYCINYVYGPLLTANRNIKQLIYSAIAGVLVNVTGCILVAEKYGAAGIAVVCMLTIAIVAMTNVIIAHSKMQVSFSLKACIKQIVFGICVFVSGDLINLWVSNFWLQVLLLTFCAIVALLTLKIVAIKNISLLLKKRG